MKSVIQKKNRLEMKDKCTLGQRKPSSVKNNSVAKGSSYIKKTIADVEGAFDILKS